MYMYSLNVKDSYLTIIMTHKVTVLVHDSNVYSRILQSHVRILVQLHVSTQEQLGLLHVLTAVQHGNGKFHQHAFYVTKLFDVLHIIYALNVADVDHVVGLGQRITIF